MRFLAMRKFMRQLSEHSERMKRQDVALAELDRRIGAVARRTSLMMDTQFSLDVLDPKEFVTLGFIEVNIEGIENLPASSSRLQAHIQKTFLYAHRVRVYPQEHRIEIEIDKNPPV